MNEFKIIEPLIDNLRAIERFNPTKCRRCHWDLHEGEENYCSSCIDIMRGDEIENEIDNEAIKRAKEFNPIIKIYD